MKWYLRDGTPIDTDADPDALFAIGRLFEKREYQVVAQTLLWNFHWVSTVWIGLNHNYWDGPPLIFETMVFTVDGDDADQIRYATEEEAWFGHAAMVRKWRWKFPRLRDMVRYVSARIREMPSYCG